MTIYTLGNSAHFVYQWDDTVNGSQQRAAAVQATCERDLSTLESLFKEFNGFDGNSVTVIAGNPGPGKLASNTRFHSDGTTSITVTAWSGVNPAATADAGARLEFIAEMSEVVMGLSNAAPQLDVVGSGWQQRRRALSVPRRVVLPVGLL